MANLKEIRNRIASVGSTMQITSAMKMVSAAKLKRAQDAVGFQPRLARGDAATGFAFADAQALRCEQAGTADLAGV